MLAAKEALRANDIVCEDGLVRFNSTTATG